MGIIQISSYSNPKMRLLEYVHFKVNQPVTVNLGTDFSGRATPSAHNQC